MEHHNKINRAVYKVRLAHNLKKASLAEIQLTIACCYAEIERRKKGAKKKK